MISEIGDVGREVRGDVGREVAKLFLVGGIGQGEIKFSGGGIGQGVKKNFRGGNRAGRKFFSERGE